MGKGKWVGNMTNKNKTAIRTMELIHLFTEHSALTFQEIIDISGIPKSSVFRMLSSLEEMKFLEKGEDAKYRLGTIFLKLGHLVSSRLNLRQIAAPIMEALHKENRQAINLAILEEDEAVYIEKIDYYQRVKLYTSIGRRSPLYGGACARAILSFLPDPQIEAYLKRTTLQAHTTKTIVAEAILWHSIKEARKVGYTVSKSELETHTASVAAPIYDYQGQVIASISIAGIEHDFTGDTVAEYGLLMMKAARDISQAIGYLPKES